MDKSTKAKACKYPGCKSREVYASVMLSVRKPGREGKKAGGVITTRTMSLCLRHTRKILTVIDGMREEKPLKAPRTQWEKDHLVVKGEDHV